MSLVFNFDDVRKAVAMVEDAIARTKAETSAEHMKAAMAAAADPFHEISERPIFAPMMVAMWKTETTFPMILRRSLLIAIYSHVEHILKQWCNGLQDEWSLPGAFKSFQKKEGNGKGTPETCLLYLRDVAKLSLDNFQSWPEWAASEGYRAARNCLAHDGGTVVDAADRAKIETLACVSVDDSGLLTDRSTILLLPGSCEEAVNVAEGILAHVLAAYRTHPTVAMRTQ
jgi:hypothetical protein